MSKIKQFTTILVCNCVGRPVNTLGRSQGGLDGRIKCDRKITVPVSGGPMSVRADTATGRKLVSQETAQYLDDNGWRKLKTLGHFQRLCPSCSKFVIEQREQERRLWG